MIFHEHVPRRGAAIQVVKWLCHSLLNNPSSIFSMLQLNLPLQIREIKKDIGRQV